MGFEMSKLCICIFVEAIPLITSCSADTVTLVYEQLLYIVCTVMRQGQPVSMHKGIVFPLEAACYTTVTATTKEFISLSL